MSAPTVAALYVEPNGAYANLPGVEVWDEARDARLYAGPWPVVAHPPCAAWCNWAWLRERDGHGLAGDDGGCFAAALDSVDMFGGVLEHPRGSKAWARYGLTAPTGPHWRKSLMDRGWVIEVDQADFGAPMHKRTWLYAFGVDLPVMTPRTLRSVRISVKNRSQKGRSETPPAFRDVLLAMARSAARERDALAV